MKESDEIYKGIISLLIIFILVILFVSWFDKYKIKEDAIANGVGEYKIVNTNTGKTQFFWITNR